MKLTKLIVFNLLLVGVSFSYTSDAPKMLDKASWIKDNAWALTSDKFDSAYDAYVAKWQKDHSTESFLSTIAPGLLVSPEYIKQKTKYKSSLYDILLSKSFVAPDLASEVKPSVEEGLGDQKTWFWNGGRSLATDSAVASAVATPSVVTAAKEGSDGESAGSSAPVVVEKPVVPVAVVSSGGDDWDPFGDHRGGSGLFAGLTVYPQAAQSLVPAGSILSDDGAINVVNLEQALFDNNYDQLIAMTLDQKMDLVKSRAGSEDPRAAFLAELQTKVLPLRRSPQTTRAAGSVVSDDGSDSGYDWGDFQFDNIDSDDWGDFQSAPGLDSLDMDNVVSVEKEIFRRNGNDYNALLQQTMVQKNNIWHRI